MKAATLPPPVIVLAPWARRAFDLPATLRIGSVVVAEDGRVIQVRPDGGVAMRPSCSDRVVP